MTAEQKILYKQYQEQITQLYQKMEQLNPFATLKTMSNKAFGEEWSENYIISQCPSFSIQDQKGWDLWSKIIVLLNCLIWNVH